MELDEVFVNGLTINQADIERRIATELDILIGRVRACVDLLKEGSTIPFISRYRKEATGTLDEVQVRDIQHKLLQFENLETRRIEIIKTIFGQGKLTEDLYTNITKAMTIVELEDLYAPYKKKKKTRGMIAIEKGLEELADLMEKVKDIEKEAERFINPEKEVNNVEEALQGASDIVAERVSQSVDNRKIIKEFLMNTAQMIVKGLKNADTSVYKMYYDYKEPLTTLKAHRVLAINRGEKEEELISAIDYDDEKTVVLVVSEYIIYNDYHKDAIKDGLKRLLIPAVIREIRTNFSEEADNHGIGIFAENLKNLLLQPPIRKCRVLGVDPGIRTGTKCAALDENGKYLGYFMVYQDKTDESKKIFIDNVKKYNIELIAVGNGTGSHEVQKVVSDAITDSNLNIQFTVVSEDGASVYSASDVAREEFPELDLTIRGAISIGRRILDPLAELVKIDPKSIGVGLYQHDVNQTSLSKSLDEVVESVVNNVGVNVNTSSFSLLKYVSGVNSVLAKNIVEYRDDYGTIKSRSELRKIQGFGDKTFELAAGFLKIPESEDILDNSWVHPENYEVAREILMYSKSGKPVSNDVKKTLTDKYDIGETTINDIIEELKKPNRDPREGLPQPIMSKGVIGFEDLKEGMKVTGKVKNVVDFGAFIDIGLKETGLIHVSEMSNKFIKSPSEVLKVGDVKDFFIIEIDKGRKRISLSLKDKANAPKKFNMNDYMVT